MPAASCDRRRCRHRDRAARVGSQEIVEFECGTLGLAFSLKEHQVGVALLGSEEGVREGSDVRRTGHLLHVPAGESVLGRVIDSLGRPMDGRGAIVPAAWMPAERAAPGVVERRPVDAPLHTGHEGVDALVPIGRGQRELVIGDRKMGKTTLAVDTILAQKGRGVACVYCAIGQKASTVRQVVATLEEYGALDYTAVVVALPGEHAGVPLPGALHRVRARRVLHGPGRRRVRRLRRPDQARDDLPRDVRAARPPVGGRRTRGTSSTSTRGCSSARRACGTSCGGGSLTAHADRRDARRATSRHSSRPTSSRSATARSCSTPAAFNEGRRPAMDPGLSVSRVGGSAQTKAMKQVAGRLRIDLAQYGEMARFVKFGAEVDETTQLQLTRGERARSYCDRGSTRRCRSSRRYSSSTRWSTATSTMSLSTTSAGSRASYSTT